MSDEFGGQQAVDEDRTEDGGKGTTDSAVLVIVEIGDKLVLTFDADGCRVETVLHLTRLTHAEFDQLVSLPICAIRSALRTDVGLGSGANGLAQESWRGGVFSSIDLGVADRMTRETREMVRRQQQEMDRGVIRNRVAQTVIDDVSTDDEEPVR